jgi:hypothetical protein
MFSKYTNEGQQREAIPINSYINCDLFKDTISSSDSLEW